MFFAHVCFGFFRLYLMFLFPSKLWKLQNLGCHAGCWGKLELMQKLFDFSPRCVFKCWGKLKPKTILVKAAQNKNLCAFKFFTKYYSSKPHLKISRHVFSYFLDIFIYVITLLGCSLIGWVITGRKNCCVCNFTLSSLLV